MKVSLKTNCIKTKCTQEFVTYKYIQWLVLVFTRYSFSFSSYCIVIITLLDDTVTLVLYNIVRSSVIQLYCVYRCNEFLVTVINLLL